MNNRILVVGLFLLVAGCGPKLAGEDEDVAQSLIIANMVCQNFANYKVGVQSLRVRPGMLHRELAKRIADHLAYEYDVDKESEALIATLREDLEELFNSEQGKDYEAFVESIFRTSQIHSKEIFGYSYPDCQMVSSMSQTFIDQKGL